MAEPMRVGLAIDPNVKTSRIGGKDRPVAAKARVTIGLTLNIKMS